MSRLTMHLESNVSSSPTFPIASRCRPLDEPVVDLSFPHQIFVPEHYEPGYDYPLVVWLHSDASSECELENVMMALSRRNYIAVALRANHQCRGAGRRFHWGTPSALCDRAEDRVWDSVQGVASRLSVNTNKVFLAGFGSGGTMAQWIGLKYANQVAGVVSLSGSFPRTSSALSNWKRARKLPVLFFQRQGSTICGDDELVRAVRISHQAGLGYQFCQMRTEDNDCSEANELDSSMLDIANRFMMGIVTGTEVSLSSEETCDNECIEFGYN